VTRDLLLQRAIGLFALRGVDGVSVAELADAAGISKANVLHHYKSKDALYAAALDHVSAELALRSDRARAAADPPAALVAELTDWAATEPDQVRLTAFGLLRLPEHPGPWRLSESVGALIELQPGDTPDERLEALIALLGRLTYGVMVRPLFEQPTPAKKRRRTRTGSR
jgi:AcrR family transcriptional regulator